MKYPPGVSTYGADDGGCFFCAESALRPSISLTGTTLNEHCRKMCDADPEYRMLSIDQCQFLIDPDQAE